ncbi:hypothetical protein ACQPUQ_10000 [Clostridium paraputrificum]|mgnify:FL=1|uniref:hypothetical protein n=1 Tax=Clostridium TaxID=1485 RepID=UPI002905079E|nr:hypothetical protein [Clostridium sp.]MDU1031632.1 hypothetical protein [Clostridium sp.]
MYNCNCDWCDDTGVYLEPCNNEVYSKAFDRYDAMGIFNNDEARKKALDDSGYTCINPCPYCGKSPADYKK